MNTCTRATAVALGLISAPLAAETATDTLENVIVRAAREPIEAARLGSSVSVLSADLLAARQSASLGEILRSVPGIAVSRVGVTGSQTQLRLRGSEANHVLVFIDGIKANDPAQNNEFNMAHMLTHGVESVEVIRGPQSALWGSDALAGVINITTRRGGQGLQADARVEGGGDGWQNYGASVAFGDERLQASLDASYLATDGDNISRTGDEDDGYENRTLNLGLGYRVNETLRLEGRLRYSDANNEFDGVDFSTGLPADSGDETDTEQLYGRLAARLDTLEGRWTHTFSAALTDTDNENRIENAFAPTGFDITSTAGELRVFSYQTSFSLAEGQAITAAFEHQQEDFKQRGPVVFGDPNRDEDMDSDAWILEYRGDLTPAVSLLVSARHDDNSDFDDETSGRLSAAWRINDVTRLRAAWGKGIKNPTFTERFGFFTDFIGNPDLKPEQSSGWEAGVDQRLLQDRLELSLTWFDEELEDEINGFVFDPASGGFTAENEAGSSQRQGLEFSGSWALLDSLSLGFAYTWLDATEEDAGGNDVDEIRRPEHSASANLDWGFSAGRGNLNINIDYNGEQQDYYFPPVPPYREPVELDEFYLLNVAASYQLIPQLQFTARVENALDEDYEEVYGYVAPGRGVYAGFRYTFAD